MRKGIRFISVLLVIALLVSCGAPKKSATEETASTPSYGLYGKGSNELVYDKASGIETESTADSLNYGTWSVDSENKALTPFTGDIASLAKADGTLRFYFMSGEGIWTASDSEKIGDGCIVFFPNGEIMIIDSDSNSKDDTYPGYTPTFMENLKRMGVKKVDYYVQSHPHSDHNGAFLASNGILASGIPVGHVYDNGTTGNSSMISKCKTYNVPCDPLVEGMSLDIGDVHIDVYNPEPEVVGKAAPQYKGDTSAAPENNAAIVMKFNYQGVSFLFDGDLYTAGMDRVVARYPNGELDADIMKMCHHGHSETSLSKAYYQQVTPRYAVTASACIVNNDVYTLCKSVGADVKCDYVDGYMIFALKDNKIYIKTSRADATSYYDCFEEGYDASFEVPAQTGKVKYPNGTVHASDAKAFAEALSSDAAYIVLDADINLKASNIQVAGKVTGKTIDLGGHKISGIICSSITGNEGSSLQSCKCTFSLIGGDFTLKNGTLELDGTAPGYALLVNTKSDISKAWGMNTKYSGVVIENITIPNGGVELHGCDATIRNCSFTQPAVKTSKTVPTISVNYGNLHIYGGSYCNYEQLEGDGFVRWLKVYYGQVWSENIKHNKEAGHYQYVTHSMYYPEKSVIID